MTSERLATTQVDSVLSADGRRPARPPSSYDLKAMQTSAAEWSSAALRHAYGSHLSILCVIEKPQFSSEAVVAHAKVPNRLFDGASELTTQRYQVTAEDTHLLLLAADDPACVDRQTVRCLHRCDPINDDLVVTRRRAD